MPPNAARRGGRSMAERADRYDLYQRSVQDAPADARFLGEQFQRIRGRPARSLREDFCGTAALACEFVAQDPDRSAVGVDQDPAPLAWGREHNLAALPPHARERVRLIESDVLEIAESADVIAATNFSYWIFETRDRMRRYFRQVREALPPDGLFFLDAYGGSDCHEEKEYVRDEDGFQFIWDQAAYDPITGHMDCAIHYQFPDRSRIRNAFRYSWRFWTLPEIRELLAEAGFPRSRVLWEGSDENGDGNGLFEEVDVGSADETWIAYLICEP